jgi:hypothetical protein
MACCGKGEAKEKPKEKPKESQRKKPVTSAVAGF